MFVSLQTVVVVAAVLVAQPETVQLELAGSQHIDHATHHVQGLAATRDTYWISSVDRAAKKGFVFRVERAAGKVVREREVTFGDQFHPGGIDLVGDVLWVPVAEYRPRSTTTIVRLDAKSLETLGSFTINDHIGCLAVTAQGQILAGNWDARTIYRLDAQGKKLGALANPRPAKYQDMKMLEGVLLAAGTELIDGRQVPVVDRLEPTTLELISRWQPAGTLRTGGNNFCREGCAAFEGELFLMPEDGPNTTIYRFALPVR